MESKRFDALTRGIGANASRRGLFKGLAAAVAGLAGVRALESDASASGMARITIHNAQCHGKPKGDIYAACHDNGFGCVNFTFRGRTIRTNANGVATARIGAGSFAISQQASRVRKSSSVYVYCSDTRNGKVLYDGGAPKGVVSFHVPTNANVVCDWYNIAKTDLSMPGQCPRPTTTTTTTTTTIPGYTCDDGPQNCFTTEDCANIPNAACLGGVNGRPGYCYCPVGYVWSDDGSECESLNTKVYGPSICRVGADRSFCSAQLCDADCAGLGIPGGCFVPVATPGEVAAQPAYTCAAIPGSSKLTPCPCALDEVCVNPGGGQAFCAKYCVIR